jgi:D-sedoheptulose 7-phosphate isomerase
MSFLARHLAEAAEILTEIDANAVEKLVALVADTRDRGGRIFFVGVGGSAANCSHAVNDFRKLAQIECYAPTDNASELTARINDDGWDGVFAAWLAVSRLRAEDLVFVLSVGGGSEDPQVSTNLIRALDYAASVGAHIAAIVGRDGGYAARIADACVIVPTVNAERITPHVEATQVVLLHAMVTHPALARHRTRWESLDTSA